MTNFEMPPGFIPTCQMGKSNTPLQALNLLNDPVFYEAARALAVRILTEPSVDFEERLDYAFRLCLARDPDQEERQWLRQAFHRQQEILQRTPDLARLTVPFELPGVSSNDAASWVGASRVLLNLDEFITRE